MISCQTHAIVFYLQERNSDIKDMFGLMEQVASAPQNFLSNLMKGKDK